MTKLNDRLDALTHKLLHKQAGMVSVHAEDVLAGTFGAGVFTFPDALNITGVTTFSTALELYHPASTPYIDFHAAANAAGDSGADFEWRFARSGTHMALQRAGASFFETGAFRFYDDGNLHLTGLGVGVDNTDNVGIHSASPVKAGIAFLGSSPTHGAAGWAQFSHKSLTGGGDYSVLQHSDGTTHVNSASTRELRFLINNTTHVLIQSDGDLVALRSMYVDGTLFGISGGTLQIGGSVNAVGVYYTGGGGAVLRDRSNDNNLSFDWDGAFKFWVDVSHVKTFIIDHPLDTEKHLVHATLEGPENGVYYRGQSQLVDGWIQIDLPEYFEALCAKEGRSVQLTCIADDVKDEWCPVLHATYPQDGRFHVGLGSGMLINDQRFWWEVKAIRKDVPPLQVEPNKKDITVMGDGPYTYYKEK